MLFNVLLIALIIALFVWVKNLQEQVKKQDKALGEQREALEHLQKWLTAHLYGEKVLQIKALQISDAVPATQRPQTTEKKSAIPLASATPAANLNPPRSSAKKNNGAGSVENWLGRNVLGVAASVLVFAGLIFLGVLVYEHLSDIMKLSIMFAISALITGLGLLLTNRRRNPFTVILTGCGCGALFISILLTHIYFGYISDITAFALLAIWTALTLFLAGRIQSLFISIIAHIGMMFSLCFAYSYGINDEKLSVVLIYQAVSSVIIIAGNILCFKKTYRLGLILSLALSVIAGAFMRNRFYTFTTTLPGAALSVSFMWQFLCASFLSYLLAISASRLKGAKRYSFAVHIANKLLWVAALFVNLILPVREIAYNAFPEGDFRSYNSLLVTVAAALICLTVHATLTLTMSTKLNFKRRLEQVSVLVCSVAAGLLLLALWIGGIVFRRPNTPLLSYLLLPGLPLLLTGNLLRDRLYRSAAYTFFTLDLVFMLYSGYAQLERAGTIVLPISYMLLYLAVLGWQRSRTPEWSARIRTAAFFIIEFSLLSIFSSSSFRYREIILLLILTLLNALVYALKYDKDNSSRFSGMLFWLNELILKSKCRQLTANIKIYITLRNHWLLTIIEQRVVRFFS